ncbi:MAG: hypothetical protein M3N52_00590, partial [Actinomycetota bacterium]|nr:hypothetical protein [Actinomycetota bacterium]
VSVVRSGPSALCASEPTLEANVYAVAEDLDLTIVLRGRALELAIAGGEVRPGELAGVALPPAASGQDLQGLIESGVAVLADGDDLAALGLAVGDLVRGVRVADTDTVAAALRDADAVLCW